MDSGGLSGLRTVRSVALGLALLLGGSYEAAAQHRNVDVEESVRNPCVQSCAAKIHKPHKPHKAHAHLHPAPSHPHPPHTRRSLILTHTGATDAARPSLTASCRTEQAGVRVVVFLRVENGTGFDVTDLLPSDPQLQIESNTQFAVIGAPSPRSYAALRNGAAATFLWAGRFHSAGAVGISVSASGTGPDGDPIGTPLIDCGNAVR